MFQKLLVIIVACGVIGCFLLVNRQQRIETAHRMSEVHARLNDHERVVWRLRSEIAERCSPRSLNEAAANLALDWEPMVIDPVHRSKRAERFALEPVVDDKPGRQPESGDHDA